MNTVEFKEFIRNAYAWPGGYRLTLAMQDGEALCHTCARDNAKLIIGAIRAGDRRDPWAPAAIFVHWEGEPLTCAHCYATIESEYS